MAGTRSRILVVDDESNVLALIERALEAQGLAAEAAGSGQAALEAFTASDFDIVLLDLRMPGMDGFEVMSRMLRGAPDASIIVMTGYSSIEIAVRAMREGAVDYITKPLNLDHLELVVKRVLQNRKQQAELDLLHQQVEEKASFEGLVGVAPEMRRIYDLIRTVAPSDTSVLIQGETGTGKELVARAIHRRSPRSQGPMVSVNCGALPEGVLESEIFGHERGAFTSATSRRKGFLEQASGGTLLLDEIEEMDHGLQVRLLRVLEQKEVVRVGGERTVPLDFRLIAAANRDLREEVAAGAFRPDLFYRVNTVTIDLPPLRYRKSDIPLLVDHFVEQAARRAFKPVPEVLPEARMLLAGSDWPGNVRELRNVVDQAVLLAKGGLITLADFPDTILGASPKPEERERAPAQLPLREARDLFEKDYLEALLRETEGNVSEAARRADINRQHLHEKMKQLGIDRPR